MSLSSSITQLSRLHPALGQVMLSATRRGAVRLAGLLILVIVVGIAVLAHWPAAQAQHVAEGLSQWTPLLFVLALWLSLAHGHRRMQASTDALKFGWLSAQPIGAWRQLSVLLAMPWLAVLAIALAIAGLAVWLQAKVPC